MSAPVQSGRSGRRQGPTVHGHASGEIARHVKDYTHIVIDTEANPSEDDFKEAAEGWDLLIIPAEPSTTAKDCLIYTLAKLRDIGHRHHRIFIDRVSPASQTEGQKLRAALIADKIPVFKAEVPMQVAFKKTSAEGMNVADISNRNAWRAWKVYRSVGKEIVDS